MSREYYDSCPTARLSSGLSPVTNCGSVNVSWRSLPSPHLHSSPASRLWPLATMFSDDPADPLDGRTHEGLGPGGPKSPVDVEAVLSEL